MEFIDTNDVLKLFYRAVPYGMLELTLIKEGSYPKVHWVELPSILNNEQLDYLSKQNELGWNIYFGVTVRNGKAIRGRGHVPDALFTRVLWVDMDDHSPDALSRLQAVSPSLIIDSGGGYHGYFLLNHVLVMADAKIPPDARGQFIASDDELLKRTLKGLAIHLQGDVKVAEFARIMRLPGFKNMKPERGGAMCDVLEADLVTYDFSKLANKYAWYVKDAPKIDRAVPNTTTDDLPKSVRAYLDTPLGQGERNNALNKAAYTLHCAGKHENEIISTLSSRAAADGLSSYEIERTIRSACSAVAVPIMTTSNRRIAARDRKLRE